MIYTDLITDALQKIGALASGESPSTQERDDAFDRIKDIIEAWNAEPDLIVKQTVTDLAFAGTASAALGTRPLLILAATAIYNGVVTVPVEVCTPTRWAEIALDRAGTATFPKGCICDYGYASATIYVGPKFTGTLQIVQLLPGFTEPSAVGDTVTLPPGYRKALMYALAVELAPEYDRPVPAVVAETAVSSKAALQRLNAFTRTAVGDAAVVAE